MKEENINGKRPNRDTTQPSNGTQPSFNASNQSRSDQQFSNNRPQPNLSKPPKRDTTGRRVDVDDSAFGVEIW